MMKSVVLIAGPTASGKSAFALDLAQQRHGSIINADALQLYAELAILSARPGPADMARVPHLLYGSISGLQPFSVADWLRLATEAITTTWAAGRLPVLVGGTGLYFKALEQGLADIPPTPPDIRDKWRSFTGDLHGELTMRDAEGARLLQPADRQRLTRALEVLDATGQPLRHWQALGKTQAFLNNISVERHFMQVPREELYQRAEKRFDLMLEQGAVNEVRALLQVNPGLPMMKAIGVPELSAHLRGEISLAQAAHAAKLATRHYIKRQLTWWRGQMQQQWG